VFSTTLSYGIGVRGADNLGDIRDEIQKVLGFWDIQNSKSAYPAEKVEKIIFAGYKSNDKELANKLLEGTNLSSTVGDVWLNLSDSSRKNVSNEVFEKSLEYVTAIGAALTCEH
jgi:hypothetical protein